MKFHSPDSSKMRYLKVLVLLASLCAVFYALTVELADPIGTLVIIGSSLVAYLVLYALLYLGMRSLKVLALLGAALYALAIMVVDPTVMSGHVQLKIICGILLIARLLTLDSKKHKMSHEQVKLMFKEYFDGVA